METKHYLRFRNRIVFSSISLFIAVIDLMTKHLARIYLSSREPILLIPHVLSLKMIENEGAMLGLFQYHRWIIILMPFIIIPVVVYFFGTTRTIARCGLTLLLGGTIGNLVSRIFGGVTDFLELHIHDFPIFNIADLCISISILLILSDGYLRRKTRGRCI